MKVIILILAALLLVHCDDDTDFLCSEKFCTEYLEENTCSDLPQNCQIQNQTHNGIFLPFAGPCHCCEYCISNLDEGDYCAIGDAASPIPTVVCGDLLYCTSVAGDSICQALVSDCTTKQSQYESKKAAGTLGHLEMRDNCDRRGLYEPYKCIPGEICYCVNKAGERIFGEIPYTTIASSIMNCECSRKYEEATVYLGKTLNRAEFLRCQANGDYDPIQCPDEEDCFCVHSQDGSLAINGETVVNSTSISNETLSCFDNDLHVEGEYYRECEKKVFDIVKQMEEYQEIGYEIIGYTLPNCQLDGYYAPVQQNETAVYCSDPQGNVLEDFYLDPNDPLVNTMDCKCARSRAIAQLDKPQCCPNGNYNPMQCRRGLCRCVDENGNQTVMQVPFAERQSLECYEESKCGQTDDTDTEEQIEATA